MKHARPWKARRSIRPDTKVAVMSHAPFIAVIPARLASTRLPNKPLADIDGKPMVVRAADD